MRTDVATGSCQLSPDPRVRAGGEQVKRERRNRLKNRFDKRLAEGTMLAGSSMNAVHQLARGDRRDRNLLMRLEPVGQTLGDQRANIGLWSATGVALEVYEDGRV